MNVLDQLFALVSNLVSLRYIKSATSKQFSVADIPEDRCLLVTDSHVIIDGKWEDLVVNDIYINNLFDLMRGDNGVICLPISAMITVMGDFDGDRFVNNNRLEIRLDESVSKIRYGLKKKVFRNVYMTVAYGVFAYVCL